MVNHDLQALSARLEKLRPQVEAAYEKLDARWEEIASTLQTLPIPLIASYQYESDPRRPDFSQCLEWRKWKGKKRICSVMYYEHPNQHPDFSDTCEDVLPYEEWSAQERLNLLKYVPGLFEAATTAATIFISQAKNLGGDQ